MSIESRILALETLLDPGSDKRVEQECQARRKFTIGLAVWLIGVDDVPEAWRVALNGALQALNVLSPLPKHPCAAKRPLTDEEREMLRWMETLPQERWSCRGTVELDRETMELWTRFAPHVPFPLDEGRVQIADEAQGSRLAK